MLCPLLQSRDRYRLSQALALLQNFCWRVQAFELSLRYKTYQSRVLNKRATCSSVCSTLIKVTDIRVEDQQIDGFLDSRSLLWMDWTHFFVRLKLFVLHMESAEISIFLFLPPVQTVKNKSRAPDIILLQQWGDVGFFFFPCEILCEYMVLFPKENRLETCLGIRSRSVCCHSNFALVTVWNSALPLKKRAEASPKRGEKTP